MSNYNVSTEVKNVFNHLLNDKRIVKGLEFIVKDQNQTISDQKEIVMIEAPTFNEEKRAQDYAKRLKELGLKDVHIDKHGNVLGYYYGNNTGPTILLEAHLDTVFPFGTDVIPVEKDGKIFAPGICDDTRGLAANLSVVRAIMTTEIKTLGNIIVAGTIAEEGIGGMYGMKTLLEDHPEIDATISIDGAGCDSIVFEGTGIRNYEVTYTGPGGHAYGAFGLPSPLHAAARTIASLSDMRPPNIPKTTFTVSLIEGGHQIHAIADRATFKINMRSDTAEQLDKLEAQAIKLFELGAKEENERWGSDVVKVEYQKIHDTPAGSQPNDCIIVQAAWKATESIGIKPRLAAGGCTNTNMPISMGIPSVTLGRGGNEGGVHSLNEWFDPTGVYRCSQKSFLMLLALAGVEGLTKPLIIKH